MDEIMFRHVRLLQQKHFGKKVDCVTKFDKLLCILKYGHTVLRTLLEHIPRNA